MPSRTFLSAGSVAGILTISSSVLVAVSIAIWSTGGSVGLGSIGVPDAGGMALFGAIALASVGLAAIGLVGPKPFDRRVLRGGLIALAFGLSALGISSLIGMTLTYDPLESWPAVISLLAGLLGLAIGVPVTILGFLTTPGPPRRLATVFLAGLLLATIGVNIVAKLFFAGAVHDDARPLLVVGFAASLVGAVAMIGAFAGIGVVSITSGRSRS
jgi:hypothetical protein